MDVFGLIIISIIPGAALFFYFLKKSKNQTIPLKRLIFTIITGVILVAPIITAEIGFTTAITKIISHPLLLQIINSFIGIALIEEGCTYIACHIWISHTKKLDTIFDTILICIGIALGIATIENILYVIQGGVLVGLIRGLLTIPMHILGAAFMGYYIGKKKFGIAARGTTILIGLGIPVLLHGAFNIILESEQFIAFPLACLILGCYILSIRTIMLSLINTSQETEIYQQKIYTNSDISSKTTDTDASMQKILFLPSLAISLLFLCTLILIIWISIIISNK